MAVRLVEGWVEQPMVRPRGGRAATRASNIKAESAERLADLVGGYASNVGVSNTDTMKRGRFTPEVRVEILKQRIKGYDARLADLRCSPDTTLVKLQLVAPELVKRREETIEELASILADLAEGTF